jgi:hypothetical protein
MDGVSCRAGCACHRAAGGTRGFCKLPDTAAAAANPEVGDDGQQQTPEDDDGPEKHVLGQVGSNVGVQVKTDDRFGQLKSDPEGAKLAIIFTCTVCETRASKVFHKSSYEKGLVIVTCPGCSNHHLIADHLGWFADPGEPRTIEEIMAEKGADVKRIAEGGTTEVFLEDIHPDAGKAAAGAAAGALPPPDSRGY